MWNPETYNIAASYGPSPCAGYVRAGLGLHLHTPPSPKGRRKAVYILTHLNTGHALCEIQGDMRYTAGIGNEIHELLETWDFTGLEGWKNQRPDLPHRMKEIMDREGGRVRRHNRGGHRHEVAQQVLAAREG